MNNEDKKRYARLAVFLLIVALLVYLFILSIQKGGKSPKKIFTAGLFGSGSGNTINSQYTGGGVYFGTFGNGNLEGRSLLYGADEIKPDSPDGNSWTIQNL